jgi:hypothetical protein
MDWSQYTLKYINSYDGEDAMGDDVSGRNEYFCPVTALRPGEDVVWNRPFNGYPSVKCKAVTEEGIVLLYTNYFNPIDRLAETREVTLTPINNTWGHSLGGGRYYHTYDLLLVKNQ